MIGEQRREAIRMESTAVFRKTPWVVTASVILVVTAAVVIRLWPYVVPGGLTAMREYDDAVMFTASLAWLHGLAPYDDVVFLHPPGILVLLAPVAALAGGIGDSEALGLARIAWALLGGLNTALIRCCCVGLGQWASCWAAGTTPWSASRPNTP